MSLRFSTFCETAFLFCAGLFAAAQPGDGSGAYLAGKYRNLFAEDGHSQREIHAKVDASFKQLFHGDPQMRRSRLRPAATPMGR